MAKPRKEDLLTEGSFFDFVSKGQTYNSETGPRTTAAINGTQQYAATTHTVSEILQGGLIQSNPADSLLVLNKALTDKLQWLEDEGVSSFSVFSGDTPTSLAPGAGQGSNGLPPGADGGGGTLNESWVRSLPLKHENGAIIWQGEGKASVEMHLGTSDNIDTDIAQHKQLEALPISLRHPYYMDRIGGIQGGEEHKPGNPADPTTTRMGENYRTAGAGGAFGYLDPESEQWYCLPHYAQISIPGGTVAISELEVGQAVYSYELETGLMIISPVIRKEQTGVKRIYHIKTKSRTLEATGDHKVFVIRERGTSYEWVQVLDLRIGDFVVLLNDKSLKIALERIKSVALGELEETWDIEVQDSNCFFSEGILVHNCSMAWPYKGSAVAGFRKANRNDIADIASNLTQSNYKGKRILVYSKDTKKGVVCTPGDWGPHPYYSNGTDSKMSQINGFYMGISPDVVETLGIERGGMIMHRFMPDDTPLGPYSAQNETQGGWFNNPFGEWVGEIGAAIGNRVTNTLEEMQYAGNKIANHPNLVGNSTNLRNSLVNGFLSQTSTPAAYLPAWFPEVNRGFYMPSLLNYLWLILESGCQLDGSWGMGYYHRNKIGGSSSLSNHARGGALDIGGLGYGETVGHSSPKWRSYCDRLFNTLSTMPREARPQEVGCSYAYMYSNDFKVYRDGNPNHLHIGFGQDQVGQLLSVLKPGSTQGVAGSGKR